MGIFDVIKSKKGSNNNLLKQSSLEKIVFNNTEEIEKMHEEIEAINLSYEKYRKTYKSLVVGFCISILLNVILVVCILGKLFL